jgi:hypothetical protein
MRQKILRPVKKVAVALNLMPKTMNGKKYLKRLVFGSMMLMPESIDAGMAVYAPPDPIPPDTADRLHKVIYCAATVT